MPVEMMDALRGRANRTIATNAEILKKTPPEKQWSGLASAVIAEFLVPHLFLPL